MVGRTLLNPGGIEQELQLTPSAAPQPASAAPTATAIDLASALHYELAEINLDEFDLDTNTDYSRR